MYQTEVLRGVIKRFVRPICAFGMYQTEVLSNVLGRFVRLSVKAFLLVNSGHNEGRRMPRPRLMERPRKVIFKIDEEDYERLKEMASKKGMFVSELLREIVKQAIQGNIPLSTTEVKDEDPVILVGISRSVTAERMLQLIDGRINNELSRAKARVILNGIIELKKALTLQSPTARELSRLKARLRELREQYVELSKEVRARSVLKPLGEELVMLSEELGVPLFDGNGGKRRA
jgi:hypothetical protein